MTKVLQGAKPGGGGSTPFVAPNSLLSDDVVEFVLGVQEGPIGGLVSGPKSFYLDDTPLVSQSGSVNFNPFELHLYHGDATASDVRMALGGSASNTVVNVTLAENTEVIRVTPSSTKGVTDQLEVRLQIGQLVTNEDNGDQVENTARFEIQYREEGTTTWLNFYDTTEIELTGKTTGGYVKDFIKGVPRTDKNYEIRVQKNSPDGDPNNVVVMTFESFQCVTKEDRSYDNLAVVRGIGRASDQFQGIPSFAGVYAGLLVKVPDNYDPVTRYYNGSWNGTFKLAHTDNPAWCLYDLLTNTNYGWKRYYPDLLVDRFSFYEAAKWCDTLVEINGSGTYQPRWTYNDRIDESRNALEHSSQMAGLFGGVLVSNLNQTLTLKLDKPGTVAQIFGPESISAEGFQYQFSDITQRINDVTVQFTNPHLNWEKDVRNVVDEDLVEAFGRISDDSMVALGCNNVHEAERRAHRRILQANTELVTTTFRTPRAGVALEIFDLIGIVDPAMNWGLSGRVVSQSGTTIYLRDALTLPVNTDLTLTVQAKDGPKEVTVQSASPVSKELTITGGSWPTTAPEKAHFALTSENDLGLIKPFRILRLEEDPENPDLRVITALEHNVNKYGDNDNLVTSDTVDYSYRFPLLPDAPTILTVASGDGHLFVNQDGSVNNRVFVSWRQPPRSLAQSFIVEYRQKGIEDYQQMSVTRNDCYIPNVRLGQIYEIRVRAVGITGNVGPASAVVEHTPIGDTVAPDTPENLTATASVGGVFLKWTANTEGDFSHYELLFNTTGTAPEVTDEANFNSSGNSFGHGGLEDGVLHYYWVRAVDKSGNASPWSDSVTATPILARTVSLTATTQLVAYGADNLTPAPGTIALQAIPRNEIGTPYFQFSIGGVSQQNTTSDTFNYTPPTNLGDLPQTVRVDLREGSAGSTILATDYLTIFGFSKSGDAITGILSNESHACTALSNGTNPYMVGSGTRIQVYRGATRLTYDGVGTSEGTYNVTSAVTAGVVTVGALTASSGDALVADHSAFTSDNAVVRYTVTGVTNGVSFSLTLDQTLSKSRSGNGIAAIEKTGDSVKVTYESGAEDFFTVNGVSEVTKVDGQLTVTFDDGSTQVIDDGDPGVGIESITRVDDLVTITYDDTTTSTFTVQDGVDAIYGDADPVSTMTITKDAAGNYSANYLDFDLEFRQNVTIVAAVRLRVTRSGDSWSTTIIEPTGGATVGATSMSAVVQVTGQTATLVVTHSSGAKVSVPIQVVKDGATGEPGVDGQNGISVAQITVYKRASSAPATPTGGSFDFATKVISAPSGWSATIPAGSDPLYASLATASIVGNTGSDGSLTWSLPAISVKDGKSTYQAAVYTRSATAPAAPSGGSFNFTNNTLTVPGGWSADVPTDDGNPVWVTRYLFSMVGDTGSVSAGTWSSPSKLAANGAPGNDGADGVSTYLTTVFKRASSPPSLPTGGTYNFGTQALTPPSGWEAAVPSGTDPIYVSTALASVQGTSGVDTSLTWTTVRLLSQNGSDGSDGIDGRSIYLMSVYQRSSLVPSTPTGGSYSFTNETGTAPNGWSTEIPDGPNPVYISTALASIVGTTGEDTTLTWSTPRKFVQDGRFSNLIDNPGFIDGDTTGWTLIDDTADSGNLLRTDIRAIDATSLYGPEQNAPSNYMLRLRCGDVGEVVAEYSPATIPHTDTVNYAYEHTFLEWSNLIPITKGSQMTVSFKSAEAAPVDGWLDAGDLLVQVRVHYWDDSQSRITTGDTYEDSYRLISGNDAQGQDIWRTHAVTFEPPEDCAYVTLEFLTPGSFGVCYLADVNINEALLSTELGQNIVTETYSERIGTTTLTTNNVSDTLITFDVEIPDFGEVPGYATTGVVLNVSGNIFLTNSSGTYVDLYLDGVNLNYLEMFNTDGFSLQGFAVKPPGTYTVEVKARTANVADCTFRDMLLTATVLKR